MGFKKSRLAATLLGIAALTTGFVNAHEHHEEDIPDGQGISAEPLDSILWVHIVVQMVAFGIIFPAGMVLGVSLLFFDEVLVKERRIGGDMEMNHFEHWL